MENATKALEMAASVLIGVLILAALVFGYSQIAEQKKIEQKNEKAKQLSDYNINFESYAKDKVYGSELLSLANEIINYNTRKATEESGYQKIELEVTMKEGIMQGKFFETDNKTYSAEELSNGYKSLSKAIKSANETSYGDKNIAYWSNVAGSSRTLSNSSKEQLQKSLNNIGKGDITDSQLSDFINKIETYNKLINEQKEFARKTFKYIDIIEYNQGTGRVVKLTFSDR